MHTLRLFCDVAACRSFSQAAARHGITQSAASQRVHQLEKRLGVTLIDRSVRPLELTDPGREYLRESRELLERYDRLEQRISAMAVPRAVGQVRVHAIYSAGIDLLNQVKDRFELEHPQVRVHIEYQPPEQVHASARGGDCDLGLISYPDHWKDVGHIRLRDERMAVICSPEHPWAARARASARELDQYPMAGFEPALPAARHIRRYLREHGVTPRMASVFDNIDTIKAVVAVSDRVVAVVPRRTAWREHLAGALVILELEPRLLRPIGIIHPRPRARQSDPLSAPARLFADYLLRHAGPDVDLMQEIARPKRSDNALAVAR